MRTETVKSLQRCHHGKAIARIHAINTEWCPSGILPSDQADRLKPQGHQ